MNQLQQLSTFQRLLRNYKISDKYQTILQQTPLVLLAATTSSGRNTILRELVETSKFHYIVSDTTRKPRHNDGILEQNGVEYWFKSEEEFLNGLQNGEYLEAAVIHNQQASGVSIREIEKARNASKIAITDIEVQGVDKLVSLKPDAICIFVLPPNFDEWQRRLIHRGFMQEEEYIRRLESATSELTAALNKPYYQFVINDEVENAVEHIDALAKRHSTDDDYQKNARKLAQELLEKTKAFLKTQN